MADIFENPYITIDGKPELDRIVKKAIEAGYGIGVKAKLEDPLARWKEHPEVSECFNRCCQLAHRLRFPGYSFNVTRTPETVFVFVTYQEPDVFTGVKEQQQGRRWVIENDWTEGQIVQSFFKAVLTSMEHRTREHFTFEGRAIFNPHHTLDDLYKMAAGQEREVVEYDEDDEEIADEEICFS